MTDIREPLRAGVKPIAAVDVPLSRLEADVRDLVARQRAQARAERIGWLLAHPPATRHATPGEAAELRHLLYDADPDASTPAFPYPTSLETP